MIFQPPGSAPDARAYFLLLRQKKVAKEKATPGYAVGYADCPALLEGPGGCGTRGCAPQTVLADSPRPFSVARRFTWGPERTSRHNRHAPTAACCGRPPQKAGIAGCRLSPDGFPGPLGGAEQRRVVGDSRLALSEPKASLASRPTTQVAQGTRRSRAPTQGWPFLWILSLGHTKESTPAGKAEQSVSESTPARQAPNPAPTKPAAPETNP
jgi:hypothetical protein